MAAIAPMDLVMKSDPTTIPLICTLCPKKPSFSDVSHLLTHISSKSHLSHRFKAELKSHSEAEAYRALQEYDEWYQRYGIRGLLAERMQAKEKKTTKRGRTSNTATKSRTAIQRRDESVKTEPEDFDASTPTNGGWQNNLYPSQPTQHPHNHTHGGYVDGSVYRTPTMRRTFSEFSAPATPENMMGSMRYSRFPSEATSAESGEVPVGELVTVVDEEDDAHKLKGIRYPGMGLFDAASEQQKKKRNQRKDDSVVRLMEQASSVIEPTENIWDQIGHFQRSRDIYATPSIEGSPDRKFEDDDEDEEEQDQKKKRARRLAPAAASKSRQTRYSTRNAQRKATTRGADDEEGDLPAFHQDSNDASQGSSHSHLTIDPYDVFQGGSAQRRDRSVSPVGGASFDLRRRSALNSMSTNVSISSEASRPAKPTQYYPSHDHSSPTFAPHLALQANPYFQHQHNGNSGANNPLYVQTRNGFFHPYSYGTPGTDNKPNGNGFQPINNAVNSTISGLPFHQFQSPYAADNSYPHGSNDFEL